MSPDPIGALIAAHRLRGVTADSRQVRPGDLFAALPGSRADGSAFIADALARGAAAVLAPSGLAWPEGVPPRLLIQDPEPRRMLALVAARLAGPQPARIAAITGTNGKTSVADFLRQLWTLGGARAASLGTLGVRAPDWRTDTGLTTPDPVALANTLARLAREGVDHAAMEASSHGLDQRRLDGVRLCAAAFTNLTRDHLDYHGGMAGYRAAKLRLFALLPEGAPVVAHAGLDAETLTALRGIAARRQLDLQCVGEGGDTLRLLRAAPRPGGQALEIEADGRRHELEIALPGRFQADNAIVAAALARATGAEDALALLPGLHGVRGRMELAATLSCGAAVYVDYAHTPDALERLLLALRPHATGRLWVVFGAGGDRDRGKRPLMGQAAMRLADVAVVTDDNPRGEDPAAIRAEVIGGMRGANCMGAWNIPGRRPAIAAALDGLRAGDVLVVAGKGHEQGQVVGDAVLPFDDVAVVRELAGRDCADREQCAVVNRSHDMPARSGAGPKWSNAGTSGGYDDEASTPRARCSSVKAAWPRTR